MVAVRLLQSSHHIWAISIRWINQAFQHVLCQANKRRHIICYRFPIGAAFCSSFCKIARTLFVLCRQLGPYKTCACAQSSCVGGVGGRGDEEGAKYIYR